MEVVYPTLSLGERDRRWRLIKELMKAKELDCLIVAGLGGREQFEGYLTNDCVQGIVVFPLEGEPTYLAWSTGFIIRHIENLRRGGTPWLADWRVGPTGAHWVDVLKEKGFESATIGVVGLEFSGPIQFEGYIPYKTWAYVLEHLPNATFVDISQLFAELILVKSDEELALIRHCAHIGEIACEAMLRVTKPGVSEREIFATIIGAILTHGGSTLDRTLILQSGADNTSWHFPMWLYQAQCPRVMQKGDIVQAEVFTRYGGMDTQQQMSVALKPVHPVNQQCARVARRSYEAGLNALRPGKRFQEVVEAMEVPIAEAGCWHLTPLIHSMNPQGVADSGSSVGIEQLPGIEDYRGMKELRGRVKRGDMVIKPGQVFELEPNACQGRHRVNIGGTVIVTEEGAEELNKLPTEMRVVD